MVNSLTITFDRVVTFDPGAFGLHRNDGSAVGLNVAASVANGRTIAVLTFGGSGIIGGSLADGNCTLTIRGEHIRDEVGRELDGDRDGNGGGDRVDAFFRLFGDSDGDSDVDWLDRDLFRSAFEKSVGEPVTCGTSTSTATATWTGWTTGSSIAGSASIEQLTRAAGGVLTAKQAPHRPGTAPALGLRAGNDVPPLYRRPTSKRRFSCGPALCSIR